MNELSAHERSARLTLQRPSRQTGNLHTCREAGPPLRRRNSMTLAPRARWAYPEPASSMPPGADWMLFGSSPPGGSSPDEGSPVGTSPDASEFWGE